MSASFTDLGVVASMAYAAAELRDIADSHWQGYEHWVESETGVLGGPRVRELGEQINRLGGFDAMQAVMTAAFVDESGAPRDASCHAALTEINWVWNGIGDWQA